ncbi:NAD-dependent epimerase/dehydratase [Beggiatoa sp. PS]|nr:NAD-dependent epimerase/dehydratase [Beggiatoa sp. PS]
MSFVAQREISYVKKFIASLEMTQKVQFIAVFSILNNKYFGKLMNKILVTGAAGFIGFHLSKRLLERGDEVIGLDNLNNYYDVELKRTRLARLEKHHHFRFFKLDLADRDSIAELFAREKINKVVNLAAQAGVRYSIENPYAYVDSNLVGFVNLLEGCRHHKIEHFVFASSSSVYGLNTKMPFSVHHNVDHPISLYAATKKANELMAHTYAHLYGLPTTGLRFFTVYGPWGRPDMALFKFTKAIIEDKPIDVYNYGKMRRDFTYIDDIIEGVVRVLDKVPEANPTWSSDLPDPSSSPAPYRLYNIGNNNPVELMHYIEVLEKNLGKKAEKNMLPMQAGDVSATYADVNDLETDVGFKPKTTIEAGIKNFIEWYKQYYSY